MAKVQGMIDSMNCSSVVGKIRVASESECAIEMVANKLKSHNWGLLSGVKAA
jgi:hypothetical protein